MFTSTDIRQRGVTDFLTAYHQNCALNNSIPIKPILNGVGGTTLFIDISKIRAADWPPFLQTLSKGKTLTKVDFYSSWDGRQPIPIVHQDKSSVTRQLMNALHEVLTRKNSLTKLSISKVKLGLKSASELGMALMAESCGLVELYLQGCGIGDVGFSKINKSIRQLRTLNRLDLTDCLLSNATIVMLVDTLRIKSLENDETLWVGNLREESCTVKKQLGILALNDNPKIQNSIVELFDSICAEEITCLEHLEIRNCGIESHARINQSITGILQDPPPRLRTFDIRKNPIMKAMESKTLIQLLMTKLLTAHPDAEYLDLSGISESDLAATKTEIFSKKIKKRTTQRQKPTNDSDGDFNIDDQYQDLPSFNVKKIQHDDLEERLKIVEREKCEEVARREDAENKYSELSSRIVKLENIIDSKNERIAHLEKEKDGCILVEEDLLKHIESSFANFQDLLNKLHELGLGELATMAECAPLAPLNGNTDEIRSRQISEEYLSSENF